jgi:hypothetical protein
MSGIVWREHYTRLDGASAPCYHENEVIVAAGPARDVSGPNDTCMIPPIRRSLRMVISTSEPA